MSMGGYSNSTGGGGSLPTGGYTGEPAGGTPVFKPPKPRGALPEGVTATDPFNGPGAIDFNLMEPGASVQQGVETSQDVFTGLKAFLFGSDTPDAKGNNGGLPVLGWGPIGAGMRFGSEVLANVAGAPFKVPGGVADALTRIENPFASDEQMAELARQFEALPNESLSKQAALEKIASDVGFAGSGKSSAASHYMAEALQNYEKNELIESNPSMWTGTFRPTASLMDAVTNIFGVFGAVARPGARLWAGLSSPAQGDRTRVQAIMAVGDGYASFNEDKGILGTGMLAGDPTTGLNPTEQTVYDRISSGEWDEEDAKSFLTTRGQAYSHVAAANIAGEVALDPLNLATFGAGSIAKIGSTGARMVQALNESKALLNAAKAANAAGEAGAAEKVAALTKAVEQLEAGVKTGKAAESVGSRDILGRIATTDAAGDAFRAAGRLYGGLEGTGFGRAAKITRTVIDPLHAVGSNPKAAAALDAGSRDVTRSIAMAHGELNHIANTRLLTESLTPEVADQYLQGLAIYSGNALRRVAGRSYRATQMMMADKGESLMAKDWGPLAAVKDALGGLKQTALVQLEEEVGQFIKTVWSAEENANLAKRMETLWGGRTADGWIGDLAGMTGEQKSLLHAATYGSAVQQLHRARAAVRASGQAGEFADRLDSLILLNRQTLTDLGHEGILKRIADAPDDAARMAIIEEARHAYPQLRTYVVDRTSSSETVANFLEMMERIRLRLPAQVRNSERANMPEALRDFDALITPSANPDEAVFTLGFRPKDEFLWGLERDGDGVLREVTDPWMDQSSDIAGAYSPVREPLYNIAGVPIPGAVRIASGLDQAEAIGRMAMRGVTGKMVTTAARNKFMEKVQAKYVLDDGTPALTQAQVASIWKALMDKVDESENISGVRGLSEGAIWKATKGKGVIPKYAERAGMDSRRLLVDILDAFDGDIRSIGLTQKLSGRVKLMLGKTFFGNTAGQVSEHVWPLLKFRLNPFFQLQEKIEPFILNGQRGASIAFGTKPNALDRAAMDLYTNFAEKNLIHIADNDISELSGKFALGKALNRLAYGEGAPMRGWASRLEGLTDVQGTKQLNMMRTWRKGLGKNMRAEWDKAMPGEFDRMLVHHRATVGEVVSEDDFAVFMAHSNLASNGVFTRVIDGVPHMDYTNAIMEGQWSAPQHIGEMQALNLDYMAQRLGLTDTAGADLRSSMDMRRALADGRITHQDIARELRTLGAHPDYIQRVESALRFSWPQFWQEAKLTFSMTDDEVGRLERLFSGIANQRGMTPTEYLSQVYAPHIARGTDGAIGSLGGIVDFVRSGGRVESIPDLAQLRGVAGQSDIRDFYQQMGTVFAQHLDPSAKRAFLREMSEDGSTPESITDILETWDNTNATEALMDRVMNYIQGTPGSGANTLVADEASGIASIRDVAAALRDRAGRPRNMQRAVYDDDADLATRIAQAYDQMPEGLHIATPAELAVTVSPGDLTTRALARIVSPNHRRPASNGLPRNVIAGTEKQVMETRALYTAITKPVSEGGMGIKVTTTRSAKPYASADALRTDLARGRLKVPRDGYWHPMMDSVDLAMQRAVADVFGFGQEATQFGSHDSIMSAAAMYSDEARPTYLTDEFGGKAWESNSDKVIRQPVERPTTADEYEDRFGRSAPERVAQPEATTFGRSEPFSRSVGDGVRALPPEPQAELLGLVSDLRNDFPDVPFGRIDVADLGPDAHAATMVYPQEIATVVVNPRAGWQADPAIRAARRAERAEQHRLEVDIATNGGRAPWVVSDTVQGDVYHEFGHVIDNMMHVGGGRVNGIVQRSMYADVPFSDFMEEWRSSGNAAFLSRYGGKPNDHGTLTDSESFGELFDFAFNPEHTEELDELLASGEQMGEMVMEFRDHLQRLGLWKPGTVNVPVNPNAGRTIAEVNAATPGTMRAPRRIGPMRQDLADELSEKFLGNGRYAESNPDIARVAGYMRDYMRDAASWTLETDTASQYAHLFDQLSGMPVKDALPFNVTEAALWNGQAQMMATKWRDAFRLQYFAQNRSMMQRSINHPMFGLYPASYMWGKVGPEMVKFMALEPFGAKTGAMAYTLLDIQKAVTVQRQFDPEFDKRIEEMGHSAALGWLSYMLPATPWSVPASYPSWMRNMADQGLANNAKVEAGQEVSDTDFISPLGAALKKVTPMTTQLPFFGRALDEVNETLPWNAVEEPAPFVMPQAASMVNPNEVPSDPEPAPADTLSAPVSGLGTQDILADTMRTLSNLLGGQ